MPKLPTDVVFACHGCFAEHSVLEVRVSRGICNDCGEETWRLSARYIETNNSKRLLFARLLFGTNYLTREKTFTNELVAHQLDRDTVCWITGEDSSYETRVRAAEFLQRIESEKRIEEGCTNCKQCNVLVKPVEHKSWTQNGYCSASCSIKGGHRISDAEIERVAEMKIGIELETTVVMTCSEGHNFSEKALYSGCKRPCPVCGEKCFVP